VRRVGFRRCYRRNRKGQQDARRATRAGKWPSGSACRAGSYDSDSIRVPSSRAGVIYDSPE
jgi:hypothetical protein